MPHWLGDFLASRNVRAVIFGLHSPNWMTALAPLAPLWSGVAGVREVLHVDKNGSVPPAKSRWQKTVVIPLMENHIERRPMDWPSLAPNDLALRTLRDKSAFAHYAEQQHLTRHCPTNFDSLDTAQFPCVIKRTDLNAGRGVEFVSSAAHARECLARSLFAGKPHILQKLVEHEGEYVAHCVCKNGCVLWHCVYFFARRKDAIIRGPVVDGTFRRARAPVALIEIVEAFLKPLAFSGPCNVDYTFGPDGKIIIFEINPRLGGSLISEENISDLRAALSCIIRHAA